VQALVEGGLSLSEIAHVLGVANPTVSYHARKLGIPPMQRAAKRYDWEEIQRFYDAGHSMRECMREFGFSTQAWYQAVERGVVRPRPRADPLTRYLVVGRRANRFHLKTHLFNAGLKDNRCEICGITEWLGAPLTMALHHLNGDARDNRPVISGAAVAKRAGDGREHQRHVIDEAHAVGRFECVSGLARRRVR
jgi:hypothetical protein